MFFTAYVDNFTKSGKEVLRLIAFRRMPKLRLGDRVAEGGRESKGVRQNQKNSRHKLFEGIVKLLAFGRMLNLSDR